MNQKRNQIEYPKICWFCENGREEASAQWGFKGRNIVHYNASDGDLAPYHQRFDFCPVCGGPMYTMDRKKAADGLLSILKEKSLTEDQIDAIHFVCDLLISKDKSIFSNSNK